MAIQIKLKNSVVQDSTPSASDLPAVGEIALNANINSIGGFMRASDNSIVKIFGPGSLSTPTATTTVSGISELATNSETTTGTATNRVVTPAGLNAVTTAERTTSNSTYLALAGGTLTGVVAATAGSNSAPSIHFGDSDSGIFGGTNTVSLAAGGTTRLTADTGVSVVGTLAVTGAITSTSDLTIADKIIHAGDTDTAVRFPSGNTISFETGGTEKFRVDGEGHVSVGTSTSRTVGGAVERIFQVEGADGSAGISIIRNSNSSSPPVLSFGKQRSGSSGGNTIVQDDDQLGQVHFAGADGTDVNTTAASIAAFVDGTPGSNDMPGRLVFSTTADGAASPTERLRIDSAGTATFTGNITTTGSATIGTDLIHAGDTDTKLSFGDNEITLNTAGSERLELDVDETTFNDGGSDTDFRIRTPAQTHMFFINAGDNQIGIKTSSLQSGAVLTVNGRCHLDTQLTLGSNSTLDAGAQATIYKPATNTLAFATAGANERMRIDSSGNVGLGVTSISDARFRIKGANNSTTAFNDGLMVTSNNETVYKKYSWAGIEVKGGLTFNETNSGSLVETMRIDTNGRVGIGTTSPNALLEVKADDGEAADLYVGQFINLEATAGLSYGVNIIAGSNSTDHGFRVMNRANDATHFLVRGDGNVGIGTSSPDTLLDVSSSDDAVVRIQSEGSDATDDARLEIKTTNGTFTIQNDRSLGTSGALTFAGNSSNNLVIDHDGGNVGIGTTSPQRLLHQHVSTSSSNYHSFTNSTTGSGAANGLLIGLTQDEHGIVWNYSNQPLRFATNNSERMRIDSGGRLLVGTTTTSLGNSGVFGEFCLRGGTEGAAIHLADNDANVHAGFFTSDTSNYFVVRTITNHPMTFRTNNTERMRIDSSGNLLHGVTSSEDTTGNSGTKLITAGDLQIDGDQKALVFRSTSTTAQKQSGIQWWNETGAGVQCAIFGIRETTTLAKGALAFYTSDSVDTASNNGEGNITERMRIDSSGKVQIGTTSAIQSSLLSLVSGTGVRIVALESGGTGANDAILFRNGNGDVGRIVTDGSSTSYNTSSDYRLKENVVAISDGITRLKTLKPYRFNFKADASTTVDGFLAHEVTAVPEAITGTKDEVDADNKPVYQGIDQSKLVPLLVAAVQELIGRVEKLEAA